jgi:threonyl-tRNA synthetase
VERLMALLIEHYDGKWPFWLNPRQGIILTVNDSAPVTEWARNTQDVLLGRVSVDATKPLSSPSQLSIDVDDSARSLQLKVREAKIKGYGMIIVVGPKNVKKGSVTVDATGVPQMGDKPAEKSLEMTPEELLQLMQAKVHAYE